MDKLIFELSAKGCEGVAIPECKICSSLDEELKGYKREIPLDLPEVSEQDVMRHFVNLSTLNHHMDKGFYPLGSCTMKYNPKINEQVARFNGFTQIHPLQPEETVQGALQIMYELKNYLAEISGMDDVTLQPVAGAHGEFTGLLVIRAYHLSKGNVRKKIIIPDSAHGTNPASVTFAGYETIELKSKPNGEIDLEKLKEIMNEEVAALMITNPNTLGIFESQIKEITDLAHKYDALVYMDGANLNALFGIVRPGDLGFDVMHFNLHKSFSTPHGGGGPGAGPIGVKKDLVKFLPKPHIIKDGDKYTLDWDRKDSIGKMQAFYGNFGVMLKAYAYIRMLGSKGFKRVSEAAIINSNYLRASLKDAYLHPHDRATMHEFVLSGDNQLKENGIKTLDIAKRMLDYGVHAPTIYFPLIVHEALMIEPTETESKQTLDNFIEIMLKIAEEAKNEPEKLKNAPLTTPVGRINEAKASKDLIVKYKDIINK